MHKSIEFKNDHKVIERELIELETIINTPIVNYPNLIHVLKKLNEFWNSHEEREEEYFSELHAKGFTIPIKKITFEHLRLKRHRDALIRALESGSEFKTKEALKKDGLELIKKIRQHMKDEDWILYALPEHL